MARVGFLIMSFIWMLSLPGCGERAAAPPHLVLITVDTLRADRLGCYGGRLGLTPGIDRLSESAVLFSDAYASAPSTLASVVSMLTGHHPELTGIVNNRHRLKDGIETLATHLKDRGWSTGAVVSNSVLSERSGLNRGFDQYDARFPQLEAARKLPERIAEHTTTDALAMSDSLQREGKPLFLWVHYQDPHGPYTPPGDLAVRNLEDERAAEDGSRVIPLSGTYRGIGGIPDYQHLGSGRDVASYRAAYDGEVRYTDQELGRLLEGLSGRGILEKAVVVFTADHGEGLGEGDYWFAHGEYLTEPLLRVPLLVAAPGLAPGRREGIVSLVDLFPSLTTLLGTETPRNLSGRSLFKKGADNRSGSAYFVTFPEQSTVPRAGLARNGYKYVMSFAQNEIVQELVSLENDTVNLIHSEPWVAGALQAEMDGLRRHFASTAPRIERTFTQEEREELRSLGYVME